MPKLKDIEETSGNTLEDAFDRAMAGESRPNDPSLDGIYHYEIPAPSKQRQQKETNVEK